MERRDDAQSISDAPAAPQRYETPRLFVLGNVVDLTLLSSGSVTDGNGSESSAG